MLLGSVGYTQNLPNKDTLYMDDKSFDEIIYYNATDSIYTDLRKKQIHLVRGAILIYGDVTMTADYILIDLQKNEVTATFLTDSLGNQTGKPTFDDGVETMTAASIRYNFDTEKGYIEDVHTKQDENYLYMGVAKRHPNEEVHFENGHFTTCELEEPHYHFRMSRAMLIPEKRIVTGPINLWVRGIPTPLALPFAIIPQSRDRVSGFIFPQVIPSSQFGFGFEKLGYYLPINNRLQTTLYGTLYSRGTFGFGAITDYAKKYKNTGTIDLGFDYFRKGFPDTTGSKNFRINWQHRQDAKANPYWQFRSNVNFTTINDPSTNLDPANGQYLNNAFLSDISLDRAFGSLPIRAGIKISARQSSVNQTTDLTTPVVNFNMTQVFPFRKLVSSARGWRQPINLFGITYDMEGKNISTLPDSLIQQGDFPGIQERYKNGFSQRINAKTTIGLFKNTLKINPTLLYTNVYNFQTTELYDDSVLNDNTGLYEDIVGTRLTAKSGMGQTISLTANATTVLYSYYKFIGKNKPILRHVLTPTFGYSYRPNLNPQDIFVSKAGDTTDFSRFSQSTYSSGVTRDQQLLTFGMNNTLELKVNSDKEKDSLTGNRKIKLIDNFSITGNYDLVKDSMNLSDLNTNLRISPLKALSLQINGTFSPYDWNDTTGATLKDYAINTRNSLGRFLNLSFATSYTFAPKKSLEKLKEVQTKLEDNWNADYQYFIERPEQIISFEIPWKMTVAYNSSWNANQNISSDNASRSTIVQTLQFNGDASFTKRWKLTGTANFDIQSAQITYSQLTLLRDLHCWQLSFMWTPIAEIRYFAFQMNAKSSLFQDAKIRLNRAPFQL
jgi:LptD protein